MSAILKEALDAAADSEDDGDSVDSGAKKSSKDAGGIRRTLPLEKLKKRVPDTEHLTRMRALILAANQNDEMLQQLLHGKKDYLPRNMNPDGSKEMGGSFEAVMKKSKARLERKIDKAQ